VLRLAGRTEPVLLGRFGPWVAPTREQAHEVLTDTAHYDFPSDVSRERVDRSRGATAANRSPHLINEPLSPERVAAGREVFVREWTAAQPTERFDAMQVLRLPVALSTTTAVLPEATPEQVREIGERTLAWIDALGPVIASRFGSFRWSSIRRRERAARHSLEAALRPLTDDPPVVATLLAAGIQVPIAAGAWLLVELACNPDLQVALRESEARVAGVVWETVRLCPPTWITARVTSQEVTLAGARIEAGMIVMVSPLLLGRAPSMVPGPDSGRAPLEEFSPDRWSGDVRPGAWLPFGAGPHACPGRNLGLAQLTALAAWARDWDLRTVKPVGVNQSRGIFPDPADLTLSPKPHDRAGDVR
jgi:hypothetical protein